MDTGSGCPYYRDNQAVLAVDWRPKTTSQEVFMKTRSHPIRKACLVFARGLITLCILFSIGSRSSGYAAKSAGHQEASLTVPASPTQAGPRTVNIPYIPGGGIWG